VPHASGSGIRLFTRREKSRLRRRLLGWILASFLANVLVLAPGFFIADAFFARARRVVQRADHLSWPAPIPTSKPWPTPVLWERRSSLGFVEVTVRANPVRPGGRPFVMVVARYGWPFPHLVQRGYWWDRRDPDHTASHRGSDTLPRPYWPGIVLNTLFYGVIAWTGCALVPFMVTARRRRRRVNRGRCAFCSYEFGDLPRCPECGEHRMKTP